MQQDRGGSEQLGSVLEETQVRLSVLETARVIFVPWRVMKTHRNDRLRPHASLTRPLNDCTGGCAVGHGGAPGAGRRGPAKPRRKDGARTKMPVNLPHGTAPCQHRVDWHLIAAGWVFLPVPDHTAASARDDASTIIQGKCLVPGGGSLVSMRICVILHAAAGRGATTRRGGGGSVVLRLTVLCLVRSRTRRSSGAGTAVQYDTARNCNVQHELLSPLAWRRFCTAALQDRSCF
jgi:hypothetical protein